MVPLALAFAIFQTVPGFIWFINFHDLTKLLDAQYFLLGTGFISI